MTSKIVLFRAVPVVAAAFYPQVDSASNLHLLEGRSHDAPLRRRGASRPPPPPHPPHPPERAGKEKILKWHIDALDYNKTLNLRV